MNKRCDPERPRRFLFNASMRRPTAFSFERQRAR